MNKRFLIRGRTVVPIAITGALLAAALVWPVLDRPDGQAAAATVSASKYATPITVTVSVAAADPNGNALTYKWRSSDGHIVDVNAPTTTWTLTDGPGLHFAYVLVANGHGGYTEQRVIVSTDTIGTPIRHHSAVNLQAPAAAVPVGETYRDFSNMADLFFFAADDNGTARFPAVGSGKTDLKNQMIFRGMTPVPADDIMNVNCGTKRQGVFVNCGGIQPDSDVSGVGTPTNLPGDQAVTDYHSRSRFEGFPPDFQTTYGQVLMADGTPCGTQNEFFGVESTATATLRKANGHIVAGPSRVNAYGYYVFPTDPAATTVELKCERASAAQVTIAFSGNQGKTTFSGTGQPTVSSMHATLADGTAVEVVLPPAFAQPSDVIKQADKFLAYKGIDSRRSACAYYKAVGAVQDCDSAGNPSGAIRFDDWKRAVQIDQYAQSGTPEYAATYVNKADLNLTRNHHSISYGPDRTAAYVCNHLGPKLPDPATKTSDPASLEPAQADVDTAIDNAIHGRNLVACVAMDYSVTPGVNGDKPFTRFLIFGPNGGLLMSVNLDGRREKFVPGTCVICHGGDHYAGRFPEDGSGPANIGAHFLPYDTGNFLFSSQIGLREIDQQGMIYNLNQNVLKAGPTAASQELITGWYSNSSLPPTQLDKRYLPTSWQGKGPLAERVYHEVFAKSCRGCHMAQTEGYNWDHYDNVSFTQFRGTAPEDLSFTVGCSGANDTFRGHGMPNSLVTFNRFWNSAGTTADQPQLFNDFINTFYSPGAVIADLNCTPEGP